jgi:hypothetical protein
VTRSQAPAVAAGRAGKIEVENVNLPGHSRRVDAGKYEAMKHVLLKTLPATSPGLTLAELRPRVVPQLPKTCFPAARRPVGGSRRCSWIWRPRA